MLKPQFPLKSGLSCAQVDAMAAAYMRWYALNSGGTEITLKSNPGLFCIVERCQDFFGVTWPSYTYKDCKCRAFGAVLLDLDQIQAEYTRLHLSLKKMEKEDGVCRIIDRTSLVWFAVAHEYAHCLQATETDWVEMTTDRITHEIGADFLAGACIGWHAVDFDINFLNDVDFALQLGSYKSKTHPEPHQRRLAVSTGISQGALASQCIGGDLSKLKRSELLQASRDCEAVVRQVTRRKS